MDSTFEFLIPFLVATIFTAFYFRYRGEEGNLAIISALIAFISWIACGPMWIYASPSNYAVAWLFYALGIMNLLFALESVARQIWVVLTGGNRRSDLFEEERR